MRSVPVLALILAACSTPAAETPPRDAAADEAAIRGSVAADWDAAQNAQDIEAMMALYADDAVRMNAHMERSVGNAAIREQFLRDWSEAPAVTHNVVSDVIVSGDLAAARGSWTATVTPNDGGEPIEQSGSWTSVLLRQADGSWKNLWDIWNEDTPPMP